MQIAPLKQPRFRIILPVTYVIIGGVLFIGCVLPMGHSRFCDYSRYSTYPAGLIGPALWYLIVPWKNAQPGSPVWQPLEDLVVPLAFILACAQYYLFGLLLDRLLAYRSRK